MTINFDINRNIQYMKGNSQSKRDHNKALETEEILILVRHYRSFSEVFNWWTLYIPWPQFLFLSSLDMTSFHQFTGYFHCTLSLRDCSHYEVQKHQTSTWLWLCRLRLFSHQECCYGSKHYCQRSSNGWTKAQLITSSCGDNVVAIFILLP